MIKWVKKKSAMWSGEMEAGAWEGMHINKGKENARIELRIIYEYNDFYASSGLQSRFYSPLTITIWSPQIKVWEKLQGAEETSPDIRMGMQAKAGLTYQQFMDLQTVIEEAKEEFI